MTCMHVCVIFYLFVMCSRVGECVKYCTGIVFVCVGRWPCYQAEAHGRVTQRTSAVRECTGSRDLRLPRSHRALSAKLGSSAAGGLNSIFDLVGTCPRPPSLFSTALLPVANASFYYGFVSWNAQRLAVVISRIMNFLIASGGVFCILLQSISVRQKLWNGINF